MAKKIKEKTFKDSNKQKKSYQSLEHRTQIFGNTKIPKSM